MNTVERAMTPWSGRRTGLVDVILAAIAVGFLSPGLGAADAAADDTPDDENGDVTTMAAFNVKDDRLEDFGFRVSPAYDPKRSKMFWPVVTPVVDVLLPNTAATKAGMRPGDRIVLSDGEPTGSAFFSFNKWRRIQEKKWAEVAAGKQNVTWTLEVESAGTAAPRTLKLVVPTPSPHWGASVWQAPEDRRPATVAEPGPLAERARQVLDNGLWILLRASYVRGLNLPASAARPYFLCYTWTQWSGGTGHRIYVSQERGRTDIILEAITREGAARVSTKAPTGSPNLALASSTTVFAVDSRAFLTSPSGALERAWLLPRSGSQREIPGEEARAEFEREMDFWVNKVGKVSSRWPMGLLPVKAADGTEVAAAPTGEGGTTVAGGPAGSGGASPRAAAFLRLPVAGLEQRALLAEALRKLGIDEDRWAYTETSRSFDDKRVTVKRVDPSQPEAQRCVLLKVDGKPPTPAEVKRWRDEGRDTAASLGDLPPIAGLVELEDVRILANETAAVVFELPLRANNAQFPVDKFQALFRVNKTQRAFEDIVVKLRESVRVAGIVSISEAGMEVRFQTIDPRQVPQPVWLKVGGAVRLLLVKISRSFEATRTDFKRVEPYEERTASELDLPKPVLLPAN